MSDTPATTQAEHVVHVVGGGMIVPGKAPARVASNRAAALPRRADLQGLRAVAILLVALNHAGIGFLRGGFVGVDVFFVLSGFLITGLLVAEATNRGFVSFAAFYARRGRRILPAATLTLVVSDLVAYHLLNFVRAKEVIQDSVWASLFGANIHFANIGTQYFARGQPPSALQHFWSLSVEEQFYVVWPMLLSLVLFRTVFMRRARRGTPPGGRAMRRLTFVIVGVVAASLAWSVHYTGTAPGAAFFSSFTRAWELGLGAVLAIEAHRFKRLPDRALVVIGWLGLVLVGIAAVGFSSTTAIPGYAALLPTVGAAFVIVADIDGRLQKLGAGRLLSLAPLGYIGDRSYTLYLWHWPVLIIALVYVGHSLSVETNLLLLAGAFVLSMFTYKFFENPIRRGERLGHGLSLWLTGGGPSGPRVRARSPSDSSRPLIMWPAAALVVLLVAAFTLSAINQKEAALSTAGAPLTPGYSSPSPAATAAPSAPSTSVPVVSAGQPLPAVVAAVQAANRKAAIPADLSPPVSDLLNSNDAAVEYVFPAGCAPASDNQTTSQVCQLGDVGATKSIVVMGDSHAQMWMPTILQLAAADGWVVRPLVKSGCSPSTWTGADATVPCVAWLKWALSQARLIRPSVILIGAYYGGTTGLYAQADENGITTLTSAVRGAAKHVILIADDDGIAEQPVDCLLARGANMSTCTDVRSQADFQINDDLAALAASGSFTVMPTRGWFCDGYQCPLVVGRTVVYRDLGHITAAYALALYAPFRSEFRRAAGLSGSSRP
jgi:peptidoglycan/LPS O-acetylase OafA/YrhL